MKGQRPYQEGTPCSQCPSDYRCENSLCGELGLGWGGTGKRRTGHQLDGLEAPEHACTGEGSAGCSVLGPWGPGALGSPTPSGFLNLFCPPAQPLWRPVILSDWISTFDAEGSRKSRCAGERAWSEEESPGWAGPTGGRGQKDSVGRVKNWNPAGDCPEKVEVQAQRPEDLDKEVDEGTTVSVRRNNIYYQWRTYSLDRVYVCVSLGYLVASP